MKYSDLKVLILDDNKLTVAIIEKSLLTLGIHPTKCTSEFDAFKALRNDEYHILFLDYNLTTMTGGEFILKLGKGFGTRHLKIFMVSGTNDEEIIAKCLSYGADDYIMKPFDKNTLKLRVHSVLNDLNWGSSITPISCLAFCNSFDFLDDLDNAEHIRFTKISTLFDYNKMNLKEPPDLIIMDKILFSNLKRSSFFDDIDAELKIILLVTDSSIDYVEKDTTNRLCDVCYINKSVELVSRINYHALVKSNSLTASGDHKKILVVEDTALYLKILKGVFSKLNYDVHFCETGGEAIQKLQEIPFDLVLLDLILPDYDGYDILDMVKENNKLSETPVVVMSGMKDSDKVKKAILKGAVDFIIKPYNFSIIKSRVEQAIIQ